MKTDFLKDFTPQFFISMKNYSREKFMADLMAGLIVGIVALPLAIAFGIASGVSPEKGLYTAIIAGFIISFLGGNSVQIGGPTGAFIVIVANILEKYPEYGYQGLAVTTLMAGAMLVLMGVLKLGVVIKYIPYPIIVGYMSGIAVTIFSTQMKDFFGLSMGKTPPDFLGKWSVYLQNIDTVDLYTIGVGVISILIIIFSNKICRKVPGPLLAIVVMTVAVYFLRERFGIHSVATIGDTFKIASELPTINSVSINIQMINDLFPAAFSLAILGAIESLVSVNVADGLTGEKSNLNMELVAQGIANMVTPMFKGIPATGALARTVTNINSGARTPVAGIVHSTFLLLIVLFLGGLTKHIPMACLAAILFIVSYNMSEWRSFLGLLRNSKADIIVLLSTFFLTVIFDLTIAIEVGLLLAAFLFLKRVTESTQVSVMKNELDLRAEGDLSAAPEILTIPKEVKVFEIDGPFFFGVAHKFDESMRAVGDKSKIRIIRMRKIPFIDSTGLHNLKSLCVRSKEEGTHIILSGVRANIRESLNKAGFPDIIGEENICDNINIALDRAKQLLKDIHKEQNK